MAVIPLVDTTLGDLPLTLNPNARDFSAIRADALSLIRAITPEWTDFNPEDPGIALIEGVSSIAAVLHYAVDRVQNEGYLLTAQQRTSVVQLLDLIAYRLRPPTAASVPLTISTTGAALLEAGTFFVRSRSSGSQPRFRFELLNSVVIPGAGTWDVDDLPDLVVVEGETVSETLGPTTGQPRQRFTLARYPMMSNPDGSSSVRVTIDAELWEEVSSFLDTTPTSKVYRVEVDALGRPIVIFGDGVSGAIPTFEASILVTFRVGNGALGNGVGVGALTEFPTTTNVVSVTNLVQPSGGSPGESISDAKRNGPLSVRALDRAVTLQDYEVLARQVTGVAAARAAHDESRFGVVVYIAAGGDNPVPTGRWFPRLDAGSGLLGSVGRYLTERRVSPRLDVQPCRPTTPKAYLRVVAERNTLRTDAYASVERSVLAYYASIRARFGESLPLSDLIGVVENTRGVKSLDVLWYHRIPTLRYVRGVFAAAAGASLTISSMNALTLARNYEILWQSAVTFRLREDGGDFVTTSDGVEQLFTAGVEATVNEFSDGVDETVPVRQPQFSIIISLGATPPVLGDIWAFGVDAFAGNLQLFPDEVVVPATVSGLLDPEVFRIEVVGGVR